MDFDVFRDREETGRYVLAVLRILLGWIMLWPFFDKMFGLGFATPAGQGFVQGGSPHPSSSGLPTASSKVITPPSRATSPWISYCCWHFWCWGSR